MSPVDDKDECGLWGIGACKRFKGPCSWHDRMYVLKEENGQPLSRKEVDKRFLRAMLIAANKNPYYVAKAYMYYGLTRALGGYLWKY